MALAWWVFDGEQLQRALDEWLGGKAGDAPDRTIIVAFLFSEEAARHGLRGGEVKTATVVTTGPEDPPPYLGAPK
jgi:hypothetical protein